jgi:hypothetical protein
MFTAVREYSSITYFKAQHNRVATLKFNRDDKMAIDRDNIVVDMNPRAKKSDEKMDNSKVCLLSEHVVVEINRKVEAQGVGISGHPSADWRQRQPDQKEERRASDRTS